MDPSRRYSPYRLQTVQISAYIIRVDSRDPRSPMNPLAGIYPSHRNYPGYRHSSPDGDSPPFRITATHPAVPQPIMNYESCIMHCYTFSAKEKDSETGLSYFGSRYYSSDLSVWLSVDPMSAKYPSLSPYVYCANNPVKLVDPNGEEMLETDYRNCKGELLYRTNDGLDETIIVSECSIPDLKQKLQNGVDKEVVNSPEYNKKVLHPLGKTPEQYKASKDGSESNIIGDAWKMYYRIGYEEAYRDGKKNWDKLIFYGFQSLLDISRDAGGGMQEKYNGWSTGQTEGLNDKRNGYINAMNPESGFKNNAPLIKLNI